mmetsp:Transcript_40658/g.96552  ORF Transcript_40658/g.96552 Transcript_40658/m.96552 type:complete len:264 (-) Transcript_40658:623-1414(-)
MSFETWYLEIPIITRCYFTISVVTTLACYFDLISPFTLYLNYRLIWEKMEVWRIFSNFFFFGMPSLDFVFHMYFLVRYCRWLEETSFRGKPSDMFTMILFGASLMLVIAPFSSVFFLGHSLTFMMVYVWSRRNDHRMNFMGFFFFNAPYLPWVLLVFSMILGASPVVDLVGIIVGHLYYYLEDIVPRMPGRFHGKRLIFTPSLIHYMFEGPTPEGQPHLRVNVNPRAAGVAGVVAGAGAGEENADGNENYANRHQEHLHEHED